MTSNSDDYTSDELSAPSWLNEEFLAGVLRKHEKAPELQVLEVKMSPASVKGDHYASVMFRAAVQYSCNPKAKAKAKSLIIKTMPEQEGHKKEMLGESHIFETEIVMYTEVLPKFEAILREAGDETVLCVPCIYHSLQPRQLMIFEDLVAQGYSVVRNRDANIDELRAALSKLGKWHAASYKVLAEQPELLAKCKYDLTTLPNFLDQKFLGDGLPNFIQMLGKVPSLSKYQKYFEPMQATLVKDWAAIIREYRENRQANTFYVLCHGDFHLRNMMFKFDQQNKALEDCMLLDFQMAYVGPMTNDLIYAIYMLFSTKDRQQHRDELIYYYLEVFTETLQKIGFKAKAPSLVDFQAQIFDRKHKEFFLLTTFLPIMNGMRKKGLDPGELVENEELRRQLYYEEDFIAEMESLLPHLKSLGYFEPL